MKQTTRWMASLAQLSPQLSEAVQAVFACPLFEWKGTGWVPVDGSLPAIP